MARRLSGGLHVVSALGAGRGRSFIAVRRSQRLRRTPFTSVRPVRGPGVGSHTIVVGSDDARAIEALTSILGSITAAPTGARVQDSSTWTGSGGRRDPGAVEE